MKKRLLVLLSVIVFMLCFGFMNASAASRVKKAPSVSLENTNEGVVIKWNKVSGAELYSIYKRKANDIPVKIATQKDVEYTDTDVTNNTDYTYQVKATDNSLFGKTSSAQDIRFVSAPKIKSLKNNKDSISFSWKKVSGAQSYYVFKRKDGTSWSQIKTVSASEKLTCTDKRVVGGTTYYYTVRCKNGEHASGFEVKSFTRLGRSKITSLTLNPSAITVKWSAVKGADKYVIYKKTGSGEFKKLKTVSAPVRSYKDTAVKHNTAYTYRIVAAKADSTGLEGPSRSTVYLKPGKITSLTCTKNGIVISWSKDSGVSGCTLYKWSDKNQKWTSLGDFTAKSYTDKKVSHGKKYKYTLVQYNENQKSAFYKKGFSTVYMKAPSSVKASAGSTAVKISWKKLSAAKGYTVQRKCQGVWTVIGNVNGAASVSYQDKNYEVGAINEYRVCAFTSYGKGCYSSAVKIKTNPIKITGKRLVALTFDDGPYSPVTNRILDCLKKYNSKATFFVVGSRLNAYPTCLKRIANEGHEIGNHSYGHLTLTTATPEQIKSEINKTNTLVKKYTGKTAKIVRAPGGAVNDTVKGAVPYPLVNWSLDTLDWKTRNKDAIVSAIKKNVSDGSIVLMHDLYTTTGDAACEIIPWLRNNGYELVTVSELMRQRDVDFRAGKLYTRAPSGK